MTRLDAFLVLFAVGLVGLLCGASVGFIAGARMVLVLGGVR